WGGLVDLEADTVEQQAAHLFAETHRSSDAVDEDQAAWRHRTRYVPRLVRRHDVDTVSPSVRPDSAYLITGGLGGAGVAGWGWRCAEHATSSSRGVAGWRRGKARWALTPNVAPPRCVRWSSAARRSASSRWILPTRLASPHCLRGSDVISRRCAARSTQPPKS